MDGGKVGFWNAPGKSQSYLSMLYLLISFPLGIIYFVFLVTGLSLGFGLFITWFGIPILVGVMFVWLGFAYFERNLTKLFLKIDISYVPKKLPEKPSLWSNLKNRFADSYTWKSFVYLMVRFPLGILGFVILVTFVCVTLAFIATPFVYSLIESGVINATYCNATNWCWPNSYFAAIITGLFGIFMIFVSLAIFNGLSKAYGLFAKVMLSNKAGAVSKKSVKKPMARARAKKKSKTSRKKK